MPVPRTDETEKEYISRCIPMLKGEGKDDDQAAAICYSMWRQHSGKKESIDMIIDKYIVEEYKSPQRRSWGVSGAASNGKSDSMNMRCIECGKRFKKRVGPSTYEVKCPKCGSYDTEPD